MNRSANSSTTSLNEDANLRIFQVRLLHILGRWIKGEDVVEPVSTDIGDIVILLQALGYKITSMDACSPAEMFPLKNGERGNRIMVSCLHSGNRFFMEMPLPTKADCKCVVKIDENDKNAIWEVTGTAANTLGESFFEFGSELVPSVPREVKIGTRFVLKTLVSMINGGAEIENNLPPSRHSSTGSLYSVSSMKPTSSPQLHARRVSGFFKDIGAVVPPIVLDSPARDSPRYRSLDTLNKQVENNGNMSPQTSGNPSTPPPKSNLGHTELAQSSPNIHLLSVPKVPRPGSSTGSSVSTVGESKISKVSQLLIEALAVLNEKDALSLSQILKDSENSSLKSTTSIPKSKRYSREAIKKSISTAKATVTGVTSKIASAYNTKKPAINAVKAIPVSSKVTKDTNTGHESANKSTNTKNTTVNKSSKNLYAHVKSTIPKNTVTKKVENKK